MVDCSGLENPGPKSPETAEMADFCGVERAPDAMFAKRSARSDGTKVGTAEGRKGRTFRPIDIAAARAKYSYEPREGIIRHRKRTGGRCRPDLVAGVVTQNPNGDTLRIFYNGSNMPAGRMAWALYYGEDPGDRQIRYVDHGQTNIRIDNLRLLDASLLGRSKRAKRTSIAGLKGASFNASIDRFEARLKTSEGHLFLGAFKTAEQAHEAYCRAAKRRFGAHFGV